MRIVAFGSITLCKTDRKAGAREVRREGGRKGEEKDRQTDRPTGRQAGKQANRGAETWTGRNTERHAEIETQHGTGCACMVVADGTHVPSLDVNCSTS